MSEYGLRINALINAMAEAMENADPGDATIWDGFAIMAVTAIDAMNEHGPTPAMLKAGIDVLAEQYGIVSEYGAEEVARDVFHAMLAKAQTPPESGPKTGE